jgi:hypothetical protein
MKFLPFDFIFQIAILNTLFWYAFLEYLLELFLSQIRGTGVSTFARHTSPDTKQTFQKSFHHADTKEKFYFPITKKLNTPIPTKRHFTERNFFGGHFITN